MKTLLAFLLLTTAASAATTDQNAALIQRLTALSDMNELHAVMFADKPAYWYFHGMAVAYLDAAQQLKQASTPPPAVAPVKTAAPRTQR